MTSPNNSNSLPEWYDSTRLDNCMRNLDRLTEEYRWIRNPMMELGNEIKQLVAANINESLQKIERQQMEIKKKDAEIQEHLDTIHRKDDELERAMEESEEWDEKFDEQEELLGERMHIMNSQSSQIQRLESALKEMQDSGRQKDAEIQEHLDTVHRKNDELEQAVEHSEKFTEQEELIEPQRAHIQRLGKELEEWEESSRQKNQQLERIGNDMNRRIPYFEDIKYERNNQKEAIYHLRNDIDSLRDSNLRLTYKIMELQNQPGLANLLESREKVINSSFEARAEAEKLVNNLTQQVRLKEQQLKHAIKSQRERDAQVQSQRTQIGEQDTSIRNLRTALEKANNVAIARELKLVEQQRVFEDLRTTMSNANTSLIHARQEDAARFQEVLDAANDDLSNRTRLLADAQQDICALAEQEQTAEFWANEHNDVLEQGRNRELKLQAEIEVLKGRLYGPGERSLSRDLSPERLRSADIDAVLSEDEECVDGASTYLSSPSPMMLSSPVFPLDGYVETIGCQSNLFSAYQWASPTPSLNSEVSLSSPERTSFPEIASTDYAQSRDGEAYPTAPGNSPEYSPVSAVICAASPECSPTSPPMYEPNYSSDSAVFRPVSPHTPFTPAMHEETFLTGSLEFSPNSPPSCSQSDNGSERSGSRKRLSSTTVEDMTPQKRRRVDNESEARFPGSPMSTFVPVHGHSSPQMRPSYPSQFVPLPSHNLDPSYSQSLYPIVQLERETEHMSCIATPAPNSEIEDSEQSENREEVCECTDDESCECLCKDCDEYFACSNLSELSSPSPDAQQVFNNCACGSCACKSGTTIHCSCLYCSCDFGAECGNIAPRFAKRSATPTA